MRTIRGRLLAGLVLALLLGLAGSLLATSELIKRDLRNRDEKTLADSAARISALSATREQTVDGEQTAALLGAPLGVVVLDTRGDVAASYGSGRTDTAAIATTVARRTPLKVVKVHGTHLLAVRVVPAQPVHVRFDARPAVTAGSIVLTVDSRLSGHAINRLRLQVAGVVAASLVVLVLLVLLVLRVGLRPLTRLVGAADEIAAGDLERRLPTTGDDGETDRLAATVNRAFDAQAAAEQKVRAFAADASHELRTPLATISGWLDLYHQGGLEDPAALDAALQRVDGEVGRMRLLVEELSLLARLDAGRPLESAPVDMIALVRGIVEDAGVVSPDRLIALYVIGDGLQVLGDEPRLAQVLRNLVGNAVQHTPPQANIGLTVQGEGDEVVVRVDDDGPGIAPDDLPHVFERFWRAEASRSRATGGSGLGLPIVRAIVEAHGGTVTAARGERGSGTLMTVRLPRTRA